MFFVVPVWSTVTGALIVAGRGGAGRVVNPSLVRGGFPGVLVLRTPHTAKLAFVWAMHDSNNVKANAGKTKGLSTSSGRFHEHSCHPCGTTAKWTLRRVNFPT